MINLECTHSLCVITFTELPPIAPTGGTSLTTTLFAPITDSYSIFLLEGGINVLETIHT